MHFTDGRFLVKKEIRNLQIEDIYQSKEFRSLQMEDLQQRKEVRNLQMEGSYKTKEVRASAFLPTHFPSFGMYPLEHDTLEGESSASATERNNRQVNTK